MKVNLVKRKNKDGTISLRLETHFGYYIDKDGNSKRNRRIETLAIKLVDKPKTAYDKHNNKELLKQAEIIRAEREKQYLYQEYDLIDREKLVQPFLPYLDRIIESKLKETTKGNHSGWKGSRNWLIKYAGTYITFKDITTEFCQDFWEYLSKTYRDNGELLSENSRVSYFNKFRSSIKQAVREGYIKSNPASDIKIGKPKQTEAVYLTTNDIEAIIKKPCRYKSLKNAFMFCIYTGLRHSDVMALKWGNISINGDEWIIELQVKKAGKMFYGKIPQGAKQYMGVIGNATDKVFTGLRYNTNHNTSLHKWMLSAGITKDITYHSSRHTFAMESLKNGIDVTILQKMLVHSDIRTTMRYVHMSNDLVKEASDKFPIYGTAS